MTFRKLWIYIHIMGSRLIDYSESNDINVSSIRLDFLDESLSDINDAIRTHKEGNKLEGDNYTNGNLNKEV